MTPKEKAKELIEKFECYVDYQGDDCFNEIDKMLINAKQCALIAVDEILNALEITDSIRDFWYNVQNEINNL